MACVVAIRVFVGDRRIGRADRNDIAAIAMLGGRVDVLDERLPGDGTDDGPAGG